MVRRFQIEEILTQDSSGVAFHALDTETGLPVVVRRFFPFGATGGGLSADEQEDYKVAVKRLADIRHPAMRSIISGGCDPVDGIPFIATEWVEGTPLQTLIEQGPPTPVEAVRILTLALEVCDQISQVLGEDAVWVETDVQTILVAAADSGRGITFWISPLKWLCKSDCPRGLDCLVDLTEEIMGWRGKVVLDQDGEGLGGWLKWLREAPGQTPLFEAWEKLATLANTTPTAPVRPPLQPSARADAPPRKKKKSSIPFVIGGILLLAVIASGGWGLIHWNNSRLKAVADSITVEVAEDAPSTVMQDPLVPPSAAEVAVISPPPAKGAKPPASDKTPGKIAPPPPAKKAAPAKATPPPKAAPAKATPAKATPAKTTPAKTTPAKTTPAKAAPAARKTAEIAGNNKIYEIQDSALLLGQSDKVVRLQGTLKEVKRSDDGKGGTIYLMLGPAGAGKGVHGGIDVAKAQGDLAESAVAGLIGKKLRIDGIVRIDGVGNARFPVVMIDKRSAIQEIP